jgi:hypothetical protein
LCPPGCHPPTEESSLQHTAAHRTCPSWEDHQVPCRRGSHWTDRVGLHLPEPSLRAPLQIQVHKPIPVGQLESCHLLGPGSLPTKHYQPPLSACTWLDKIQKKKKRPDGGPMCMRLEGLSKDQQGLCHQIHPKWHLSWSRLGLPTQEPGYSIMYSSGSGFWGAF